MKNTANTTSVKQWVYKGVLVALIGLCLVIGVIGIILPIIPGLLFLFFAAMLLAKLSSRFASYLGENRLMQKWKRRSKSYAALPMGQRIKLTFWMAAKSFVDGVAATLDSLKTRGKA